MRLRLTPRAAIDIEGIADFIKARDPRAAVRVRSAILTSLRTLTQFPRAGRRQSLPDVRKFITRRYGYIIYYRVDDDLSEIAILTIQHGSQRRKTQDV